MTGSLVYGRHAVEALVRRDIAGVLELWVLDGRRDALVESVLALAGEAGIALHQVPRRTLDALVGGARHQGLIARYRGHGSSSATSLGDLLSGLVEPALLLVLDGVEDPHNLGACLRSADAAGVHAVVVPRSRTCGLTPAVRKVASGAAESIVLLEVANLARALRELRDSGVRVVGTSGETGLSLFEADLTGHLALVMGAEQGGLRRLTREHCDLLVRIPMSGSVESLNLSVAAGVCLFEARRQRTTPVC